MIDFAAIPPEVTSSLLYAGPGAESLLTAATAWQGLATELQAVTASYRAVLATLTVDWIGPSSAAMVAAATPFVDWVSGAAAQATQASAQAGAAASAFEVALAAVVPPPVIAANRSLREALLATNTLGQNTAAIAAADAQYAQMWAQDAAAMVQYEAAAASATRLTPFASPPQSANPAGQAGPGIAAAGDASEISGIYEGLFSTLGGVMKFGGLGNVVLSGPNFGMVQFKSFYKPQALLPEIPRSALGAGLGAGLSGGPASAARAGMARAVTAGVGAAPTVGALSVPPGWATATPAIRLAATALPASLPTPAGAVAAPAAGLLNPAALGALTGGALGAPGSQLINGANIRGGSGSGGKGGKGTAPVQLDRVLAQLQKQKDAVQHWQIDEAGLDDLLEELAKKPGFHAVHLGKTVRDAGAAGSAPATAMP
ncbi:PPE family protein PPE51_2 [Mycolicibacter sinensis]|uniref:PPE family protein PPE51_2 n=1 Tax=Mycolicibacter sinensis (strain JDM601) TaxID=875328 RepID=F5YUY2_MYCSD|nr:PPE family protein [Mycolicibacter sinensis]AEF38195.1 PPE family protein PPE51_2 [Mycolicibacter sinensis]